MRSMTGYGRGEAARDGVRFSVELSAVNRKQAEIAVSLPRDLDVLEPQVRAAVQAQVSRGRVNVRIARRLDDDRAATQVRVNRALAEAYAKELSRLAHDLGLEGGVSLDHLVRAPGVFAADEAEGDAAAAWPVIEEALRPALAALVAMRGQ
ncbi:MAG: YicC/YloC family endoribonuclease, partial [Limisphaerales bacterium]